MAADAWGLCDALGIDRAHLLGLSMGGMIVQQMAIDQPDRVLSLTSVASTTGDPDVGQPTPEALAVLLAEPKTDRAEYLKDAIESGRILAGPEHRDDDWILRRNELQFDRCFHPDGVSNQMLAILTSPSRTSGLRTLGVPSLVVHGEIDPLVTISGGERTAESLPGSEFLRLDGMGHDLPSYYWATVIHHVTAMAARSV
jgi:pimeloyl-ACP methyl ester carboxylesterase